MTPELNGEVMHDLCIIGGGPAGIIVALEYSRLNPDNKVILIEYGKKGQPKENGLDNSIQLADNTNHHNPYDCTNKGLGGSTATWGGRCVTYDEVDFMDRPIIGDNNTWNLALFTDAKKYFGNAANYFECGKPNFKIADTNLAIDPIAEKFREGHITGNALERWSMPTRFGKQYAAKLAALTNITVLTGYEARNFSTPDENGSVTALIIRKTTSHEQQQIFSKTFVISSGAQESTRLLLRNLQLFNRLANPPKALGKYYQGHVSGKLASVKFYGDPKKTEYSFIKDTDGTYIKRRFQFSSKFLVDENLLNTAIWLDNPLYHDAKHNSGAMSLMYLAMLTPVIGNKLAPPAIGYSITKGKSTQLFKHFLNIIKDLPSSIFMPATIFFKRYCVKRGLPGVFLYNSDNRYALHFHAEQVPDDKNCMQLGTDGESLVIKYSLCDADITSVIKIHEALDAWLQKTNCGRLEYWLDKDKLPQAIRQMSKDGIHQCGTTRIANSPEKGVVDQDLKLFGTQNVFVCSSSVFPTSGQANPTFFLGAFAVRLANYLTNNL